MDLKNIDSQYYEGIVRYWKHGNKVVSINMLRRSTLGNNLPMQFSLAIMLFKANSTRPKSIRMLNDVFNKVGRNFENLEKLTLDIRSTF